MNEIRTRRLTPRDGSVAGELFVLMAEVFEEPFQPLSQGYLERLLHQEGFWAMAAFLGEELVGGLTGYTLSLTRKESSEVFIYDIAVRPEHRRKGIGRALITELRRAAALSGIQELFVAADNDDVHALDFYRALGGQPAAVTFFTF